MKKLFLLFLSILVLSCEKNDGILVPTDEQNVEIRAKKNMVQLCHKLGNGLFKLIEINGIAKQTHLHHGDGTPGMCYGEDGFFMTEVCILIPADLVDKCDGLDNNCNGLVDEGVEEICNGLDDDCDGEIDEGLLSLFYVDYDGDGFGDPNNSALLCEITNGFVDNNEDCNDSNWSINPSMREVCDDVDNDCDNTLINCPPCEEYETCKICPYIQPVENITYACGNFTAVEGQLDIYYEDGTSISMSFQVETGAASLGIELADGSIPVFEGMDDVSSVWECYQIFDSMIYDHFGELEQCD